MRGNLWSINLLQLEDIVWSGKENDYQAMQITFPLHIRNFYNFLLTSISLSSTFPHHSETMEFLLCEYRSRRPSTGGKSLVNILNCCCCCYRMKSESIFNSLHTWAIFDSMVERKTLHEIYESYVDMSIKRMKSWNQFALETRFKNTIPSSSWSSSIPIRMLYGEFCFCCYFTKPTQFHNAASSYIRAMSASSNNSAHC